MIHGIKTFCNIKQTCAGYGIIINILKPIMHSMTKASLCWVSFQINILIHWNKIMVFQKINDLITHNRCYHLCNMTCDRYWTIIIFVINVAIILIDRRHSVVLPFLLNDTRLREFIYHICQCQCQVHTQYTIIALLGRDPKYVSISLLDILLKRKLWILFEPFQNNCHLNFEVLSSVCCQYWQNGDWNHSQKCHK